MQLTDIVKLPNGNLKIQLTEEGKQEVIDSGSTPGAFYGDNIIRMELAYWLEHHLGNGWECITPEEIGALTGCDDIYSDDVARDEEGVLVYVGDLWWYPQYEVRNPAEVLVKQGYVILTKGE